MELILKTSVLLLLLSSCGAEEEPCGLKGRLDSQHLDKVLGVRWVLVRAFADHDHGLMLLKDAQSSVMFMEQLDDNVTIACVERNVLADKCLVFYMNVTRPEDPKSNHSVELMNAGVQANDTSCIPYDDQCRADVYSASDDCMTLHYHMTLDSTPSRMLLIYRREGNHTDFEELKASEQKDLEMATCLKFTMEHRFSYNGTTGFCEKNMVHRDGQCFLS